ncbi:hypothetical protein LINGRAHAP2_LOCUS8138, partial [Linum grandiflorum]
NLAPSTSSITDSPPARRDLRRHRIQPFGGTRDHGNTRSSLRRPAATPRLQDRHMGQP